MKKHRGGASYVLSRNSKTKSHGGVCHHLPATKGRNRILTDQEFMPPEYYTSYVPFITSVSKTCLEPAGSAFYKANRKRKSLQPIAYGLRIIICFMLFNLSDAWGQSSDNREAAERQIGIRPLQIGDSIPEELWNMPMQVVNYPPAGGKETITLNDYRDKKLIILDFWATWCASCIATFPKLYEINNEFNDVGFIANSEEGIDKVQKFVQDRNWPASNHIAFTSTNNFRDFFPHRFLPHYVWIKNGIYIGSTDSQMIDSVHISTVLSGPLSSLQNLKQDHLTFDRWEFYARDPHLLSRAEYGSMILKNVPGINGSAGMRVDSVSGVKRYYFNNSTPYQLYHSAAPRSKIENVFVSPVLRDLFYGGANVPPAENSFYCYEQLLSATYTDGERRVRMRSDLDQYFSFHSQVDTVEITVLNIQGKPANAKDGVSLDKLVRKFNRFLRLKEGDDMLRANGNGGILIPSSFLLIDNASDVLAILKQHGFQLISEKYKVEMVIINNVN